jgi:c-di-AMP phosphodiesterase-like protein
MSWVLGLVSMIVSIFTALTFHPFETWWLNAICFTFLQLVYIALLFLAEHRENRLEKRIEELEKKLKDKEKGGAE